MFMQHGEIVIYQSDDGTASLEVRLEEETVWLTQAQLVEFFQKTKQNISLHIRNIFKEGELRERAVVKEYLTTAPDGKRYLTKYYNLDVIISVGYRIKSQRGTQFRIWATRVLKDHLVKGYTVNERRLAEQGLADMEEAVALLSRTLTRHESLSEEGLAVLEIVSRYAKSWSLLLRYDEERLELPKDRHQTKRLLDHGQARVAIAALKAELVGRGEASDLFGHEREQHLQGILGSINQTFGGQELYPTAEEKAAHLLYFVIKDHPFSDGNKRIGSFLFVLFLRENGLLGQSGIDNNTLVALALLIAESEPRNKELLVRLVVNLMNSEG